MSFATTQMDPEIGIWSEVRERQLLHDIAYMWNLLKMAQINFLTKHKQSHRHRKQTYGYQGAT